MGNKKEYARIIAGGIVMVAMYSLVTDLDELLSEYPKWLHIGVTIGVLLLFLWLVGVLTSRD